MMNSHLNVPGIVDSFTGFIAQGRDRISDFFDGPDPAPQVPQTAQFDVTKVALVAVGAFLLARSLK